MRRRREEDEKIKRSRRDIEQKRSARLQGGEQRDI